MKNLITLLATLVSSIVVAQTDNVTTNNSIVLPDSAQTRIKNVRSSGTQYIVDSGPRVPGPMIQKEISFFDSQITSEKTFTKEEYNHLAVKDIPSVAATMPGVFVDGSGNISIRGSRFYSTQIMVDGQKMQNVYGISATSFREK